MLNMFLIHSFGCLYLFFLFSLQGDADSGLDRLWQKKKAEVRQQ